jgi:hypothetical protein
VGWLLLDGGRDAVRRPGLGFLGTSPFPYENPRFWGLDFLGFPWILSSETYQWVTRDFRSKFFPRAFVVAKDPSKRRPHDSVCEKDELFMEQSYFNF